MMVAGPFTADSRVAESSFLVDSDNSRRGSTKSRLAAPSDEAPDVYGQVHPVETDEQRAASLRDFDQAVHSVPDADKFAVLAAQRKCPQLLTPAFKLLFLRCEVFHVTRAARRYVQYWEQRLEIFGPEKAFLPLTLNAALRDDDIPLHRGSMQVIRRDGGRRDLLYFDPSKLDKGAYTNESACRAMWYWFHALLEDTEVQKRGVIILMYNANFTNRNRDPPLTRLCLRTVQGALPVRVSAIHACKTPMVVSCIISVLLVFVGERMRQRILAHNGTTKSILQTLRLVYDISPMDIPTDMGGTRQLNVSAWLNERNAVGL